MDRQRLIEILDTVVIGADLEGCGYISCGMEEEVDELVKIGLMELNPEHHQRARLTEIGWGMYTGLEIGE